MTGAKRKTDAASGTNKTKLGNSNVDHSPHPHQEYITTHNSLMGSQQMW